MSRKVAKKFIVVKREVSDGVCEGGGVCVCVCVCVCERERERERERLIGGRSVITWAKLSCL